MPECCECWEYQDIMSSGALDISAFPAFPALEGEAANQRPPSNFWNAADIAVDGAAAGACGPRCVRS